ncbi:MAG: hypothetical protein QOI88_1497, partial [Gammaproteobacteria bacterium]|nr:hypothetical protein [Gammaproteobacteria bacterium]
MQGELVTWAASRAGGAACVVALLCAGGARASDKLALGPAAPWVQPLVLPTKSAPPTDAAVRILVHDRQFNFSRAFDEAYFENLIRIQTPQGLATVGTISLPWKPDTDVLTVHKLHIIRNGQIIDVLASGQTFTVLRRENNLEYSALDGVLTATIQPSGLQVDDMVDLAYSVRRTEPVLGGTSEWVLG